MTKNKYGILFGLLFVGTAFAAQACGSENTEPSDPDDVNRPQGGAPGDDTGGTGNGNTGNGGGSGGSDPIFPGPPERPDCPDEPDGTQPSGANEGEPCWDISACNPTSEEQFLEQCSGTALEVFDNDRIENFDGTLPT